jgi:N6-adenosine-specific RNA methylase IME4
MPKAQTLELVILPEIKARLFPLREEELRELERSVLEEGIRDPLVVWRKDGRLILVDGYHRYELAKKHGLSFQIVEREFRDLDEVLIWVDRNQLGRRNLTDEQRAFVMGRLYKTVKRDPIKNLKQFSDGFRFMDEDELPLRRLCNLQSRKGDPITAKIIAAYASVSATTVWRAEKFADAVRALQEISPQAAERVLRGEVRDALTELPKVPKEALSFVAEKIEEGKRVIKEILREWRYQQLEAPPLPKEKFDVIYADPPWEYEFSVSESREIENHYPTMTLDELKRLEIPAADNAVLFLWAPPPKLPEALEVMKAWGFRYVTCAVWDKEKIGMGYWFRQQHELLLVGVKGNYSPPPPDKRFPSVIRSPRTEHSRKPEVVYELIEAMFPNARLLELFARRNDRPRWVAWGAEA